MTTILTEGYRLADILRQELDGFSREDVTLAAGEFFALCAVVGKMERGAPVVAPGASNVGTGALSDMELGQATEIGAYSLTCISSNANAGTFAVFTPSGLRLADAVAGTPYVSPHLAFTLSDGETDFAVGDVFTVTVPAGSGKYKLLAPDAVDGTQHAAGITIAAYDASLADVRGVIVNGPAKVFGELLAWPDGITDTQLSNALADLAALGIKTCTGV